MTDFENAPEECPQCHDADHETCPQIVEADGHTAAEGVSSACMQGRCADCWDNACACRYCGHPGSEAGR